jgi:hypothetical protein
MDREVQRTLTQVDSQLGGSIPQHELHEAVERYLRDYDGAKVRDFVPLLVQRRLSDDLRALART